MTTSVFGSSRISPLNRPAARNVRSGGIVALSADEAHVLATLRSRGLNGHLDAYVAFVKRLVFESPWIDASLPSLAYRDARGTVLATVCVMARSMFFHDTNIRMAAGRFAAADSTKQSARAVLELTERFLDGPQDLSIAVGDASIREIWSSNRGPATPANTFTWTFPLRPATYALSVMRERGLVAPAFATLRPACRAVDATLQLLGSRDVQTTPPLLSDDLDAVTMLACLGAFTADRALRPHYDGASLTWLLHTVEQMPSRSRTHLQRVAVRTAGGRVVGWYVYDISDRGTGHVLQLGGASEWLPRVVDHLFHHARQRGLSAVTGVADSRLVAVLSDYRCLFRSPGDSWMLIHSRDSRIADALRTGNTFVSQLETGCFMEALS